MAELDIYCPLKKYGDWCSDGELCVTGKGALCFDDVGKEHDQSGPYWSMAEHAPRYRQSSVMCLLIYTQGFWKVPSPALTRYTIGLFISNPSQIGGNYR